MLVCNTKKATIWRLFRCLHRVRMYIPICAKVRVFFSQSLPLVALFALVLAVFFGVRSKSFCHPHRTQPAELFDFAWRSGIGSQSRVCVVSPCPLLWFVPCMSGASIFAGCACCILFHLLRLAGCFGCRALYLSAVLFVS